MEGRFWIGLMVFGVVGLLPWANAADPTATCGTPLKKLIYRASFQDPASNKELKILIGFGTQPGTPVRTEPSAQIWTGTRCEAVCTVRKFEKEDTLAAQYLDLDCRSAGLGPLITPATVFWAKKTPLSESDRAPMLRFGTWLNGYEHSTLRVEMDRVAQALRQPTIQVATRQ